jgi:hypothetical protein
MFCFSEHFASGKFRNKRMIAQSLWSKFLQEFQTTDHTKPHTKCVISAVGAVSAGAGGP